VVLLNFRLAAGIADGIPVNLRDNVTGLDQHNVQHLIEAIRHASRRPPEVWTTCSYRSV
jgi:hypothetical protein